MLSIDEGGERADAIRHADWHEHAARRVKKLHRSVRPFAELMLRDPRSDRYEPGYHERFERELRAGAAELDGAGRQRVDDVMCALHPQLGPVLARWWNDAIGQPYMTGWSRRALRSPSESNVTRQHRASTLRTLIHMLGAFDRDAAWVAAWAPFIRNPGMYITTPSVVGPLLASAIDAGGRSGDDVFDTLVAVSNGEHPVGVMDQHVIVGLLRSSRPAGWEHVGRLLLAAQRQEGLRQAILEAADEAQPGAFDHLVDLVLDHDLLRFAAALRAAGTWLGIGADAMAQRETEERLRRLRALRADPDACRTALLNGDAWDTYLGLFVVGMHDVHDALRWADHVLTREVDPRAATARFLAVASLTSSQDRLVGLLDDPSVDVAALAHSYISMATLARTPDAFERIERFASRLPDGDKSAEPVGIETDGPLLSRSAAVRNLLVALGDRPLSSLLPWLSAMDASGRVQFARLAGDRGHMSPNVRQVLVTLVGDRSAAVREAAGKAFGGLQLEPSEAPAIEALLTRKAGDLRRSAITLLARQPEDRAAASARRLWDGDPAQRDAACELLAALPDRSPSAVAAATVIAGSSPTPGQLERLRPLLHDAVDAPVPADQWPDLGPRTAPRPPVRPARQFGTPVSARIVGELDDLAHEHRDQQVVVWSWRGQTERLLADIGHLPAPYRPAAEDAGNQLILPHVFRAWWHERGSAMRNRATDAFDALAALVATRSAAQPYTAAWLGDAMRSTSGVAVGTVRYPSIVQHVLEWMLWEERSPELAGIALDGHEAMAASVPRDIVQATPRVGEEDRSRFDREWRWLARSSPWSAMVHLITAWAPELLGRDDVERLFGLERWLDEPIPGATRFAIPHALLTLAADRGIASDSDIRHELLIGGYQSSLTNYTRRRPAADLDPRILAIADDVRRHVISVERRRGELPTPVSDFAIQLGSVHGAELAFELLSTLGRSTLVRSHPWQNRGREAVFSHLLRVSYPHVDDTRDRVAELVRLHRLSDKRMIELAMFAPQWARLVGEALGWEGFEDAVWWFHTHTKDERWSVPAEVKDAWRALSAERTPLDADDLLAGAVDAEWFLRSSATLGAERWAKVREAARMASAGSGHRRAQIFADAMLGDLDEDTVVARIEATRHQDSVRALGLVPIPERERDATLLRRYIRIREFERGASKFGSQRQTSERLAARIGIENLARTAGYGDPQRFVWAMEALEAGDLADGPVTVADGDITLTLSVDADGIADLAVTKAGKPLKALPATLRKQPEFAALRDRKTALAKQATRVRASLENTMVRAEPLTTDDLAALDRHPVVAPMLDVLVLVDEEGATMRRDAGAYSDARGESVRPAGPLRIAHPVDLAASGSWIAWQERCFADARKQPCKQVFRELYAVTDAERAVSPLSRRYEGHQVQPSQANALFQRRGWHADREGGEMVRIFHEHRIAARLDFLTGFLTPLEAELPTIHTVQFTARGDYLPMPLSDVPSIVFSETMRDLDLVVSVAHAGGVDPEATASTVEMRAALVRETVRLAKLDNVRLLDSHVVIDGTLGEYSVHLGSGVVHRRPGGAVCIIPVDSQRRGRLFLPFADDDPKTAEVVSKVLLLARDRDIRDPSILSQLHA